VSGDRDTGTRVEAAAVGAALQASANTWRLASAELLVGGALAVTLVALALAGRLIELDGATRIELAARFAAPGTPGYPLGADHLGRDLWARVVEGLGWSLSCALVATLIAGGIGTVLGVLAAERGGKLRALVSQGSNLVLALPGLVVAIAVIGIAGQGYWTLVLTLGLLTWPVFARIVMAETASLLTRDYILAARLAGAGSGRILLTHLLTGLRSTLMVVFAFHFADMLIAESALSFLGIGAPVGTPTWGNMLADSRQYLFTAPWMLLVPGGAIVLAVVTVNLIGDGLAARSRRLARALES
jgi:peptide/nickel transport system permease protein